MELTKISGIGYFAFGKPDEEYHIGAVYKDINVVYPFPYTSSELGDINPPGRIKYKVKIIDEKGTIEVLKRVDSLEDEVLDIIRTMQNDKEYSQSIFNYLNPILNLEDEEKEYLLCSDNGCTHNIAINKNGTSTIGNPDLNRKHHHFSYINHPYIVKVYDKEKGLYNFVNTRTNQLIFNNDEWVDYTGDYAHADDNTTICDYDNHSCTPAKVVKNVVVTAKQIDSGRYAYNIMDYEGNLLFHPYLIVYTKLLTGFTYLVKSKKNKYNFGHAENMVLFSKFIDFGSLKEINSNDLRKLQ